MVCRLFSDGDNGGSLSKTASSAADLVRVCGISHVTVEKEHKHSKKVKKWNNPVHLLFSREKTEKLKIKLHINTYSLNDFQNMSGSVVNSRCLVVTLHFYFFSAS